MSLEPAPFTGLEGNLEDAPSRFDGDDAGAVVCILAAGIDVTERRRAEDRLRTEASTLEAIHRISTLIAGEMDLATIVQTITEETTALSGASFGAFFYNLTDERYIRSINNNGGRYNPGSPRSASVTLRVRY